MFKTIIFLCFIIGVYSKLGVKEEVISILESFATTESGDSESYQSLSIDDNYLQDLLQKFLDKVLLILEANDPYSYSGFTTNYTGYGSIISIGASDLLISGISNTNVSYLNVTGQNQVTISVGFNFTELQVTGNYSMYLDLLSMQKLFGDGDCGADLDTLGINIKMVVAQTASTKVLKITSIQLDFYLAGILVAMENLLDETTLSTLINNVINKLVPSSATITSDSNGILSRILQSQLNNFMKSENVTLAIVETIIEKFIE